MGVDRPSVYDEEKLEEMMGLNSDSEGGRCRNSRHTLVLKNILRNESNNDLNQNGGSQVALARVSSNQLLSPRGTFAHRSNNSMLSTNSPRNSNLNSTSGIRASSASSTSIRASTASNHIPPVPNVPWTRMFEPALVSTVAAARPGGR